MWIQGDGGVDVRQPAQHRVSRDRDLPGLLRGGRGRVEVGGRLLGQAAVHQLAQRSLAGRDDQGGFRPGRFSAFRTGLAAEGGLPRGLRGFSPGRHGGCFGAGYRHPVSRHDGRLRLDGISGDRPGVRRFAPG